MPEHIRQEPKVLVSTENLTEQEWLAYRRRGIGGSDVAAILGMLRQYFLLTGTMTKPSCR